MNDDRPKSMQPSSGGILQIRGNSIFGWKKKYFHLTDGIFSHDGKDGKDKFSIDLKGCNINPDYGLKKPFCFHVAHEQRGTFIFAAQSEDEMQQWLRVLRAAAEGKNQPGPRDSGRWAEERLAQIGCELSPDTIEWGTELLGKGAAGVVKKGKWLGTTEVAIKTLNNIPEFLDQEEINSFYKEIELLSQLRHPSIVQLYGFTKKEGYICLVTQYIEGGNLEKCLRNPQLQLDLTLLIEMAQNIVSAMIFLHSKNIIHRDLKTANILVENWHEGKVRVCDFGLSKIVVAEDSTKTQNVYGTPAYSAPELPTPGHTNKVDVYSFGLILWEMINRKVPWMELSHPFFIVEKVNAGERPILDSSHPLYSIVTRCWAQSPDNRPTFSQVFKDLESVRNKLGLVKLKSGSQDMLLSSQSPSGRLHRDGSSSANPTFETGTQIKNPNKGRGSVGDALLGLYKSSEEFIPYTAFSRGFFQCTKSTSGAEAVRYILDEGGNVHKSTLDKLLMWFSPLVSEAQPKCFTVQQIVDIVSPRWFFAFLSAGEAKDVLKKEGKTGCFLFRFSSSAGLYALSLFHNNQVSHCRIETELTDTGINFIINKRIYKSLEDIMQIHKKEPLKIVVENNDSTKVCLTEPCLREQEEAVYNVVTYGKSIYNN